MSLTWRQEDWRSRGACLSADPELFFPISAAGASAQQVGQAKAICARCCVRSQCVEFALAHRDVQGVWGGTTDSERRKLRPARAGHATASGGGQVTGPRRVTRPQPAG